MTNIDHLTKDDIKPTDILVGKGKICTSHIGTIAFKVLVDAKVHEYMDGATESCDKTSMTVNMVDTIQGQGGRFLKETKHGSGQWFELMKKDSREKVRDAFRDAVKSQKKERPGAFLSKVKLTVHVGKEDSFMHIIEIISQDPAVKRFLKASRESQLVKLAKKSRRGRRVKATAATTTGIQGNNGSLINKSRAALLLPRPEIPSDHRFTCGTLMPFLPIQIPSNIGPPLPPSVVTPLLPAAPPGTESTCCLNCSCRRNLKSTAEPTILPRSQCEAISLNIFVERPNENQNTPYDPWKAGGFDDIGNLDLLRTLREADFLVSNSGRVESPIDENDPDEDWIENLDDIESWYGDSESDRLVATV